MIVFDLKCAGDHVFEAWFASSEAYAEQRGRGLVACPICADVAIEKAVMAPNLGRKANRGDAAVDRKAMLAKVAAVQADLLSRSRWVGRKFAEEARAIHAGDRPDGTIHGQASAQEVAALVEEGVPIAPLPLPIAPPDEVN